MLDPDLLAFAAGETIYPRQVIALRLKISTSAFLEALTQRCQVKPSELPLSAEDEALFKKDLFLHGQAFKIIEDGKATYVPLEDIYATDEAKE
jgi:hypothetical protein